MELVAARAGREIGDEALARLRIHHAEPFGPRDRALFVHGLLDPEHLAAGAPHRGGEPVDRRHDLGRVRYVRGGDFLDAEAVLHVDDDQRGLARVEILMDMQPAAPQPRLFDGPVGDLDLMHGAPPQVPVPTNSTDSRGAGAAPRPCADLPEYPIASWPAGFHAGRKRAAAARAPVGATCQPTIMTQRRAIGRPRRGSSWRSASRSSACCSTPPSS